MYFFEFFGNIIHVQIENMTSYQDEQKDNQQ